jgi:hypothetical protein
VGHIEYSGVICRRCLTELRLQAIEATKDDRVLVLDYSKVLFAMAEFIPCTLSDGTTQAPAALIVQPEQYAFAWAYAEKMEELGIMRVIFLPSQMKQVWRWVDRMAGAAALRERQSRPGMPVA